MLDEMFYWNAIKFAIFFFFSFFKYRTRGIPEFIEWGNKRIAQNENTDMGSVAPKV